MSQCIFCDIVTKKSPAFILHEDKQHLAFLDIFPPTFKGKIIMPTVLIATKKHLGSNIFEDLNEDEYLDLVKYTRFIAKAVQQALNPERVCLVFEGMEIDHAHPKLYPIFADTYPGYLSTEKSVGNQDIKASNSILEEYASRIRKVIQDE